MLPVSQVSALLLYRVEDTSVNFGLFEVQIPLYCTYLFQNMLVHSTCKAVVTSASLCCIPPTAGHDLLTLSQLSWLCFPQDRKISKN